MISGLNNSWRPQHHAVSERAGLGTGAAGAAGNTRFRSMAGSWTTGSAITSGGPPGGTGAAASRRRQADEAGRELGRNTKGPIRQSACSSTRATDQPVFGAARQSRRPAHRRQADIAKLMMSDLLRLNLRSATRSSERCNGMIMGVDTPGEINLGAHALLARPVDLRRYRSGAAQHHRRRVLSCRARAAEGKDTPFRDLLVNT